MAQSARFLPRRKVNAFARAERQGGKAQKNGSDSERAQHHICYLGQSDCQKSAWFDFG
jgi:hypothetical protein